MKQGILIIATGTGDYEALAKIAVRSIEVNSPGIPVHVHHNSKLNGLSSRLDKLNMNIISPFEQTIFMDCDMIAMSDLRPLFEMNKNSPHVAMALDTGAKTCGEIIRHRFFNAFVPSDILRRTEQVVPPWAPHFNSGLVVFNKCAESSALFENWRNVWKSRAPTQDQLALMESCSLSNQWPTLIPQEWNYQYCITKEEAFLSIDKPQIKILHLAGNSKKELYQRATRAGYLQGL